MKALSSLLVGFSLASFALAQPFGDTETNPAAESLYQKAEQLLENSKTLDQAIEILLTIVHDHPKTTTATFAMSDLARAYARKEDPAKEVEWLKKCAKGVRVSVNPRQKGRRDQGDPRGSAISHLAWHYELKKDWNEAMQWWRAWEPQSWCETCQSGMWVERGVSIARCQANLGDHAAAAGVLFNHLGGREGSSKASGLLYELYREAGQLPDLQSIVATYDRRALKDLEKTTYAKDWTQEQKRRSLGTDCLNTLFRIRSMTEKRDVVGLVDVLKDDYLDSLSREMATESLVSMEGKEVPALQAAILAAKERMGRRNAFIVVLGESRSPKALEALVSLTKTETHWLEISAIVEAIGNHGDKGRSVLVSLKSSDAFRETVERQLRYQDVATQPRTYHRPTLPKAKAGSLPKKLSELDKSVPPEADLDEPDESNLSQDDDRATVENNLHSAAYWVVPTLLVVFISGIAFVVISRRRR